MAKLTGNPNGRPPHFRTPEELMEAFEKFVHDCKNPSDGEEKRPLTISGFCVYIKSYKELVSEYAKKKDFSHTIKKIYSTIENDVEEGILTNKYNATAGIFNLKNNFKWKDKHETVLTGDPDNPVAIMSIDSLLEDE